MSAIFHSTNETLDALGFHDPTAARTPSAKTIRTAGNLSLLILSMADLKIQYVTHPRIA